MTVAPLLTAGISASLSVRMACGGWQQHGPGLARALSLLGHVMDGLHDHDCGMHTQSMFGGLPRVDTRNLRAH